MADEADDSLLVEVPEAEGAQRRVHGGGEIRPRVDERPVEIEDEVPVGAGRGTQTANEEPQPQVRWALGFTNLKPAPCRPST